MKNGTNICYCEKKSRVQFQDQNFFLSKQKNICCHNIPKKKNLSEKGNQIREKHGNYKRINVCENHKHHPNIDIMK